MRRWNASQVGRAVTSSFFGLSLAYAGLLVACSDGAVANGAPDAGGIESDAQTIAPDAAATPDTGADGAREAAAPGDILGTLSGTCGEVRTELRAPTPSVKLNGLAFMMGEQYNKDFLSPGGDTLFDTPNAGGSSGESEVMSFEVLHACEGAKLVKTETEIAYAPPVQGQPASITDILVEINGVKVGVSVTRAYKPASQGAQTDAEVKSLLEKKLEGINVSSMRVLPQDKWVKQILHVFAANQASADTTMRVLPTISSALRADTIVLVTKTTGGGFIYCNPDPPLGQECP
jgi:hypothetical protein